jgi:MFS family permease
MQTAAELFLVNIISCSVGALSEVLVQTTVADMYFVHQRGNKNNIYIFMTITGNSLGPVASGYVTTSLGWRWIYWTVAIITGALTVAFFFLYEETMYTPYIIGSISEERREDALEATLTRDAASGAHDKNAVGLEAHRVFTSQTVPSPHLRKSYLRRLALLSGSDFDPPFRHIASQFWQPLAMMVNIPAVAYVCLMYGVVIAGLQIMTTTTSTYMSVAPYNFSGSQIGLMSVAPFIGTLLGAAVNAPLCDRMVLRLSRRNNGIYEPEMRLWQLLIFSPALPAGLLIYGYGLGNGDSWIVLAVGTGLFAFGLSPVTSISLTYLTDSFEEVRSRIHCLQSPLPSLPLA